MNKKQILILVFSMFACVLALGGWFMLSVERAPVSVDASGPASGSTAGIFLFANNEARFYSFLTIARVGVVRDVLNGVSFELRGFDARTAEVRFTGALTIPYEFTTLSEAQYEFPGVLVF